jgi:polyhydroxybutyrate depolymerase
MMTQRLLIEKPGVFAAGVAFISALPADDNLLKPLSQPVPIMFLNGSKDPLVLFEGGAVASSKDQTRSVQATVDWWIKSNKANPKMPSTAFMKDLDPNDGCKIRYSYYPALKNGAPVLFYTVVGGGHALPSYKHPVPNSPLLRKIIGPICKDAEGVDLAWNFMSKFKN